MKNFYFIFLILLFSIKISNAQNITKAYFGGGCFWCMEEAFEKLDGIVEVVSGYSGGKTKNPTYKEVVYGDTGHFEVIEVIYDSSVLSYKKLSGVTIMRLQDITKHNSLGNEQYKELIKNFGHN